MKVYREDRAITKHVGKSLHFKKQQAWIKKEIRLFDVKMSANDGPAVCELVAIFIFYQLSHK